MSEISIQNAIIEYLQLRKVFCWRNNNGAVYDTKRGTYRSPSKYSLNGVSDILGIYQGQLLAIEVKQPKCYPSKEQREFIQRVNNEGGIAFIARSIKDIDDKLFNV